MGIHGGDRRARVIGGSARINDSDDSDSRVKAVFDLAGIYSGDARSSYRHIECGLKKVIHVLMTFCMFPGMSSYGKAVNDRCKGY